MSRKIFCTTNDGTYYVERHFAWFPIYCQGTLAWLQFVYCTYLDRGNGKEYLSWFPGNPSSRIEELK